MLIGSHETALRSTWGPNTVTTAAMTDRPNQDRLPLLPTGKESLAISIDVAWLQKLTLDALFRMSTSIAGSSIESPLYRNLLPALVDLEGFRSTDGMSSQALAGRQHQQLEAKLWNAFEAEPLEDGESHLSETIIEDSLQGTRIVDTLESVRLLSLDDSRPDFAASVLRSLGRLAYPGTNVWRTRLVRDGLHSKQVPIRDAAVQAAEQWGDADMCEVLKAHVEPVSWLRDYVQDVIDDLEV